ncbi:MAG: hypothetical protein ACJ0BR_02915 [Candidatus Puniceispirillales bacterium]
MIDPNAIRIFHSTIFLNLKSVFSLKKEKILNPKTIEKVLINDNEAEFIISASLK